MPLHHDTDHGWVIATTEDDKPWWRSTDAAFRRLSSAGNLKWLNGPHKNRVLYRVTDGKPMASIRWYPTQGNRYAVRIEGFEFWKYNRIFGHERYDVVVGIDHRLESRKYVEGIVKYCGARVVK
jgi:hypothetical protein